MPVDIEHREHERFPYNEKILINNSIEANCHDLSLGGVFVYTDRSLLPGSTVNVTFPLDELRVTAIVQVTPEDGGLGLMFLDLDEQKTQKLNALISKIKDKRVIKQDKPTVLLVEDDENMRHLTKANLMTEGIDVLEAKNDAAARRLLGTHTVSAIVLEMDLQTRAGTKLLSYLQSVPEYRSIPVIACASLFSTEDRVKICEAGASVLLSKPTTTPVKLVEAIKDVLKGVTPNY